MTRSDSERIADILQMCNKLGSIAEGGRDQ